MFTKPIPLISLFIWIGFVAYGFFFSPNQTPDYDWELIQAPFKNSYTGFEPSVIGVFLAMGLIVFLLGSLLLPGRRYFSLPFLPFWIGSMFVGAGAILPYLIWRGERLESLSSSQSNRLEKLFTHRYSTIALLVGVVFMVGYGFFAGNSAEYLRIFQLSRLVNVMSFDFLILMLFALPIAWYERETNLSQKAA
ncbi:MAG: hypothetical protein SFT81_03615 [Candidatus Caenarcaniphilales bacterium]|nr:hypothetical protein [Candidatus Caenarcaniphilales bacterium]